jgi:hypothetical protein
MCVILVTYKSLSNFTMSQYTLNIKNWNYVFALLATVFILSSGVSEAYAAPDSPPTLKLVKSVITDDGGSAVADEWNLFAHNGNNQVIFNRGGSGIFETVPVDTPINLSESVYPAGYLSGDWACSGGLLNYDTITLSLGDRVTCTITSDDVAPTLDLKKVVIGDSAVSDDWILTATGSGPDAKRNISTPGGSSVPEDVFANAVYKLDESSDNLAYTAQNDGKWDCMVTYPRAADFDLTKDEDVVIKFLGVRGISLSEGDTAVCTITNVQDEPAVSINVPSKINGKVTLSAKVKGFEDTVPMSFKVYKMNGFEKSMVYEDYVASAPYSFTIPAKNLDAGSSYEVTVTVTHKNGASFSDSGTLTIPTKGTIG